MGEELVNYQNVQTLVDIANPPASTLLINVTGGAGHTGGALMQVGDATYSRWVAWIAGGALQGP